MTTSHMIFVYGSLKRGYLLADELRGQRFVGEGTTQPGYRLYDRGEYPCLIEVPDNGLAIQGEVFEVSPQRLQRLDVVEAVDEGLYERRPIRLQPPFEADFVWAWFFLPPVELYRDCGNRWP